MYVCMYVMYVCMYVHRYVRTYVRMYIHTYVRVCQFIKFKPLISQMDYNNIILHSLGEITPSPLKEVHHSNVCLCGWDLLNGAH